MPIEPDDLTKLAQSTSPNPSRALASYSEGTRLGGDRYELGRVLGHGGFGITYLARDTRLHRPVAIKEYFPLGSIRVGDSVRTPGANAGELDAGLVEFLDEARRIAMLSSPNIVTVFDQFEERGTAFMVMELLDGDTLRSLCNPEHPMDPIDVRDIIKQVAKGLECAHSAGLVHRDVKPSNIIRTLDNRCVLIDFGSTRNSGSEMTRLVTDGYSPPEQYGDGNLDQRADIFALCATGWFLLTGLAPVSTPARFSGKPLGQLPGHIPFGLRHGIEAGLRLDAQARPSNAQELLEIIDNQRSAASYASSNSAPSVQIGPVSDLEANDHTVAASPLTMRVDSLNSLGSAPRNIPRQPLSIKPAILVALIAALSAFGFQLQAHQNNDSKTQPPNTAGAAGTAVVPSSTQNILPLNVPTTLLTTTVPVATTIVSANRNLTPEQTIKHYYDLVAAGKHQITWDMLSPEFRADPKHSYANYEHFWLTTTAKYVKSLGCSNSFTQPVCKTELTFANSLAHTTEVVTIGLYNSPTGYLINTYATQVVVNP